MKNIEYNGITLEFYDNLKEIFQQKIFNSNISENIRIEDNEIIEYNRNREVVFDHNIIFVVDKNDNYSISFNDTKDIYSMCKDEYKGKVYSKKENIDRYIADILSFKKFICENKIVEDNYKKEHNILKIIILDKCYILHDEFKKERNEVG